MRRLIEWLGIDEHLTGLGTTALGLGGAALAVSIIAADWSARGAVLPEPFRSANQILASSRFIADDPSIPALSNLAVSRDAREIGPVVLTGDTVHATANEMERQRRCLATAIYFEARSEPYAGQLAVAEVILNRVKSKHYPNTICDVVYQGAHRKNACQFSFACDGIADRPHERRPWKQSLRMAQHIMLDVPRDSYVGRSTHYHADYVNPIWAEEYKEIARIGRHIFYAPYWRERT